MAETTRVHLLRHGEVYNPEKVLYGRLPGYRLSELGKQMAVLAAAAIAELDVARLISSPLERARETAQPISQRLGLEVETDDRLLESTNVFEGQRVGVGDGVLRQPRAWRHLWNPFKPSWGEPYVQVADRVTAVVFDAVAANPGRDTVMVSHQMPIWVARLRMEGRALWHDPRRRQCALASLTTFEFTHAADGSATLAGVNYSEPAQELLGAASKIAGA
ncbi:MAG: histidine phosphatase family protein [Actinobacteria bacterium]|nr:histidine phosphatase family protein [Actinomycetota bacterium]